MAHPSKNNAKHDREDNQTKHIHSTFAGDFLTIRYGIRARVDKVSDCGIIVGSIVVNDRGIIWV